MSESLSPFKEGYIYKSPLDISGLWIYLGLFNYLEADFIGNNLYKCEIKKNKPWFMDYEHGLSVRVTTLFPIIYKPIGCSLEDLQGLLKWIKGYQKASFYCSGFRSESTVCNYIKLITLSKDNIKLPKDFEIVSSDNNSLILLNKRI
jgi:hypothetical protein